MYGVIFKTDLNFVTLVFANCRPTAGPTPVELALGISAVPGVGSCTTHYLKASNTMTDDTVYPNEFQKNCDGQSMWPHGRYVLI